MLTKEFKLLVVLLFLTNACGAPTNTTSATANPWSGIKDDNSMRKFRDNLLNETLLDFLKDCNKADCCLQVNQYFCTTYYDTLKQLNDANPQLEITSVQVQGILDQKAANTTDFCQQKHYIPSIKYYKNSTDVGDLMNDKDICKNTCLKFNVTTMKFDLQPICNVISWMGGLMQKSSQIQNAEAPASNPDVKSSNITTDVSQKTGVNQNVSAAATLPKISKANNPPSTTSSTAKTPTKNIEETASETGIAPVVETKSTQDEEAKENVPEEPSSPLLDDIKGSPIDSAVPNPNMKDEDRLDDEDDYPESDLDPAPQADTNKKDSTLDLINDVKQEHDMGVGSNENANQIVKDPFFEESPANTFTYLLMLMFICVVLYVIYHNKSKILGLLLEGRRGQKGRGGRRKHTAAYRKLDSNLEEAMTSSTSGRSSQIIY